MLIKWIGHACFSIVNEEGVRILTDPYDNSIGLSPVEECTDILLVSHDHFDHNYIQNVTGDYEIFREPGTYEAKGIKIIGLPTFHDEEQGALRGNNIAFIIETDGIRMMHSGDLGHMPDDGFFEAAGHIDILMVPVGGTYTLDAKESLKFVDRLAPNITIPMHYKTASLNMEIAGIHEFKKRALSKEYDVAHLGTCQLEISPMKLKKRNRIVIMECCNGN